MGGYSVTTHDIRFKAIAITTTRTIPEIRADATFLVKSPGVIEGTLVRRTYSPLFKAVIHSG